MEERAYTESFAEIYDEIMDAVPYNLWYKYIKELLSYYQFSPENFLDLACGTGNMTLRFADEARRIVGIDRSGPMLKRAREKSAKQNKDIEFIQADLTDFKLDSSFNFAYSLFDSLNYILNLEDLTRVFANVYRVLEDNGIFIFDMNTVRRLMSINPGTTLFSGKNYTCFWDDIIDKEKHRWKVKLKIYIDDEYYEEIHEETGYPVEDIDRALHQVGFQQTEIYKAYTFDRGKDSDNRLYFICFKDRNHKNDSFFLKAKNKLKWKLLRCFS